jgi:hypothetical protein
MVARNNVNKPDTARTAPATRRGYVIPVTSPVMVDRDQRVRGRHRERCEEQRSNDAEERGVQANPEREHDRGKREESRMFRQRSDCLPEVVEHGAYGRIK